MIQRFLFANTRFTIQRIRAPGYLGGKWIMEGAVFWTMSRWTDEAQEPRLEH